MILWSLELKKDEEAVFSYVEREKPKNSRMLNLAIDTFKNTISTDNPKVKSLVMASKTLCKKLNLFPEEAPPECCTEESILIKRGYETLICIARFEAFEAMEEKGVIKVRTNRYFFSKSEMQAIYDFIDEMVKKGWF